MTDLMCTRRKITVHCTYCGELYRLYVSSVAKVKKVKLRCKLCGSLFNYEENEKINNAS